jgi:hypothetical protein
VQAILKTIHDGNWGDGASVAGVLISVIGFAATIIGLARSKSAAKRVADAVAEVRQRLSLRNVADDLAVLMSDIEEIKLLHRLGAWDTMPIRYASIRRRLFSVKEGAPSLTKAQRASIQGVIQQFKEIGEIVEVALAAKEAPQDVATLNRMATEQSDRLTAVLVAVQRLENK